MPVKTTTRSREIVYLDYRVRNEEWSKKVTRIHGLRALIAHDFACSYEEDDLGHQKPERAKREEIRRLHPPYAEGTRYAVIFVRLLRYQVAGSIWDNENKIAFLAECLTRLRNLDPVRLLGRESHIRDISDTPIRSFHGHTMRHSFRNTKMGWPWHTYTHLLRNDAP